MLRRNSSGLGATCLHCSAAGASLFLEGNVILKMSPERHPQRRRGCRERLYQRLHLLSSPCERAFWGIAGSSADRLVWGGQAGSRVSSGRENQCGPRHSWGHDRDGVNRQGQEGSSTEHMLVEKGQQGLGAGW